VTDSAITQPLPTTGGGNNGYGLRQNDAGPHKEAEVNRVCHGQ